MSTDHNFRKERRTEAVSNRGLSVYQPKRLTARPNRLTALSLNGTFLVTPVYLHRGATSFALGAWRWRGLHLLNIVVLAMAAGLFGLCGSEGVDELLKFSPSSPFPSNNNNNNNGNL